MGPSERNRLAKRNRGTCNPDMRDDLRGSGEKLIKAHSSQPSLGSGAELPGRSRVARKERAWPPAQGSNQNKGPVCETKSHQRFRLLLICIISSEACTAFEFTS